MQQDHLQHLIHNYLERVAAQLADLPESERDEIIEDLRIHIQESIGDLSEATETDLRNALDRLGDPEVVALEARGRVPESSTAGRPGPVYDRSGNPGALEIAAIVLTALFWPVGVLLAWISERWKTRDKLIATALPAFSTLIFLAIAVGGAVMFQTGSSGISVVSEQVQQAAPAQPSDPESGTASPPEPRSPQEISEGAESGSVAGRFATVLGFLVGIIGGPFVAAIFLAIRMQRTNAANPQAGNDEYQQVPVRGQV